MGAMLLASAPASVCAQTVPHSAEADTVAKQAEPRPQPMLPPMVEAPPTVAIQVPRNADKVHFVLKKVVIEGATAYTPEQLAEYYRDLLGKQDTLADMYMVAARITQRYLADGYLISKAFLPPQSISDGVVHIRVIEGYIRHIQWQGDALNSELAHNIADRLLAMRPLSGATLESTVLMLNDLSGVQVQATLAPGEEEGAVDAILKVTRKRVSASLEFNDYASRYLDTWQTNLQTQIAGLLTPVDQLSLNLLSSVQPQYSRYERLDYTVPVNADGTSAFIGVSRSHSAPGFTLTDLQIRSNTDYFWIGASQSLLHSRLENLTVSSQLNIHNLKTDIFSSPFYEDRIRTLQLSGIYNRVDSWNGSNMLDVDLYKGLHIFGATPNGSPMLSRAIGQEDFWKGVVNASRLQVLEDNFSVLASATSQFSNAPLLSSEQFGYGGTPFGRGYDAAEINGDEGIAGSLELRYDRQFSDHFSVEPYLFYDIGKVWNHGTPGDALSGASAGFGTRLQLFNHLALDVNLAKPLTLPASTPKLGAVGNQPRLNISLKLTY